MEFCENLTKPPVARKLTVRHTKLVCLTASFLATGGFSKCMPGLKACLFENITVAAFCIYALHGEDATKRGGRALNSRGNYIVDHGKSLKNHGNVILNFCGNPALIRCHILRHLLCMI